MSINNEEDKRIYAVATTAASILVIVALFILIAGFLSTRMGIVYFDKDKARQLQDKKRQEIKMETEKRESDK